jgi:hypothetical protein
MCGEWAGVRVCFSWGAALALPVPGALMRRAPNDPAANTVIPSSFRGTPIRGQHHRIQIEVVTAELELRDPAEARSR